MWWLNLTQFHWKQIVENKFAPSDYSYKCKEHRGLMNIKSNKLCENDDT